MVHWKDLANDKKRRQLESIPKEWLIVVPPDEVVDVTKYPEDCGLLSAKDIQITNTGLDDLLRKLASGEWSSVEVTTAFYKRAIVAHQLVGLIDCVIPSVLASMKHLDKLPDGDICRQCSCACR
jgi:amidase